MDRSTEVRRRLSRSDVCCHGRVSHEMETVVNISKSFEECDRADKAYYHSLTPHERLKILWELNHRLRIANDGRADERLERVYRIIKLS
jgi:hypothetical protein